MLPLRLQSPSAEPSYPLREQAEKPRRFDRALSQQGGHWVVELELPVHIRDPGLTSRFQGQGALDNPGELQNHGGPLSPANGVTRGATDGLRLSPWVRARGDGCWAGAGNELEAEAAHALPCLRYRVVPNGEASGAEPRCSKAADGAKACPRFRPLQARVRPVDLLRRPANT